MKSLILPAELDNLDEFVNFVIEHSAEVGFDKRTINKIRLAFEEAVVNVINYAYPNNDGTVEIVCSPVIADGIKKGIEIKLIDSGIAFDPIGKDDPDTSLPAEHRPIGGLGIFMVKKIMDGLNYSRTDNKNILTMIKNL